MATTSNTTYSSILKNPRITEKASMQAQANVYVFDVPKSATKNEIKKAIKSLYKVTPVKIAVATMLAKKIIVRGKPGMRAGGKKAMVYLKKEDKIEIV